jgi:hypothetical protein
MILPLKGKALHRASHWEFIAFVIAYIEFLLARWDAQEQGLDGRMRPVALRYLRERGIEDHLLIWMLYQGHIEHFRPTAAFLDHGEARTVVNSLLLTPSSSFALTEVGNAFAEWFLTQALVPTEEEAREAARDELLLGDLLPTYDPKNRIFCWGRHVLKCFRQPSANQVLLLSAAEEMGWPCWFDDPLPPAPGLNPKVRLHDTIKALNRHQVPHMIRFKGDGTGTRVGWEVR